MPEVTAEACARVRAARRQAGLTQEQLADRSRLSVRTIRALERDPTSTPRPDSLDRIADALGLSRDGRRALLSAWGYDDIRLPVSFPDAVRSDPRLGPVVRTAERRLSRAHTVTSIRTVDVDARGHVTRESVRRVLEIDHDTLDGTSFVIDSGNCPVAEVTLTPGDGCAHTDRIVMPGPNLQILDITFPTPLRRGECYSYSATLECTAAPHSHRGADRASSMVVGDGFSHPGGLCVVHVRFTEPPPAAFYVRRALDAATFQEVHPVHCDERGEAQLVVADTSPGFHGLAWG